MKYLTSLATALVLSGTVASAQRELFHVDGDSPSDLFGLSMRSAGDVDSDGKLDFMVHSFEGNGQVKVISGGTAEVLHTHSGYVSILGRSFDAAGDLDGDMHGDFVVSDGHEPGPIVNNGVVHVYSGATGAVLYRITAVDADVDILGRVVRSCGDLDGDGHRDLLVQAKDILSQRKQFVIAYSGASGAELFRIEAPGSATRFADSIAALGDTNGDGVDDFVLSDEDFFSFGPGYTIRGQALVYSGATGLPIRALPGESWTHGYASTLECAGDVDQDGASDILIGTEPMVQVISGATGAEIFRFTGSDDSAYGDTLSRAGDTNGDGIEDFAIGANLHATSANYAGRVYVHSGATGALLFQVDGENLGDRVGASIVHAGDLDEDGRDDILVGAMRINSPNRPGEVRCHALGQEVRLDFELDDDFMTPLENGRSVDNSARFGRLVEVSSAGRGHYGAAIFDSSPIGPNQTGADPDLLVDRGNLVILQENPSQVFTAGVFDEPDDSAFGGTLRFELLEPGRPLSVDLVDICPGVQDAEVRLIDSSGHVRTYVVPSGFTSDGAQDPAMGVRALSLTGLDEQEGYASTATATEDPGFEPYGVRMIEIDLTSSGAVDALLWVPDSKPAPLSRRTESGQDFRF